MNTRFRLGVSGSSFVRVMPQELVKSAYLDGREGRIRNFDSKQNRMMVTFMREMMEALNDSPVQSMECYHSLAWDNAAVLQVLTKNPRVEFWSVHAPYGRYANPSSPIEEEREGALEGILDAISVARTLQAKVVVVHPGVDIPYDCPRKVMLACAAEIIRQASDVAAEHDIVLGLEPLPKREIGNSLDELLELLQLVHRPNVGVTFDTNHLFPPEDVPELLRRVGRQLVNIHISDQDGTERHWLPFDGKLDWRRLMDVLAEIGYSGPLIYETHLQGVQSCAEVVSRIVENYKRLLRCAGL
ncbi:MAG: sugar phosphate isomerase/epimerase family protein [Armatimonadota bacterium]|nr:sugar phosphate isomerase/epimerase family protein [Armatimonadota bacterium]